MKRTPCCRLACFVLVFMMGQGGTMAWQLQSRWLDLSQKVFPVVDTSTSHHDPDADTTASSSIMHTTTDAVERRNFLASCLVVSTTTTGSLLHSPSSAAAADVVQEDDSLKEAVSTNPNVKTVEFFWDDVPTGSFPMAVDGVSNTGNTNKGSNVRLSYQIPSEWDNDYRYHPVVADNDDATNRPSSILATNLKKACHHIIVYQKTGTASIDRLEHAADLGIPRALDIGDRIGSGLKQNLKKAHLMSLQSVTVPTTTNIATGTTGTDNSPTDRSNDGPRPTTYFEFAMAGPPASEENCPTNHCDSYDSRTLFAATVQSERLFVFVLQCDESQWKRSSQDLLRVQSSFRVQLLDNHQ